MAAFLPLKAGGWAFGEILTSAQMNQLNTDFPFAINGRDGGSYALSGNLIINGVTLDTLGGVAAAFLHSTGSAFVSGIATLGFAEITGGADIVNGLTVDTIVTSGVITAGATIVGSGGLQIAGNALFGTNINVSSQAAMGSLACSGAGSVGGALAVTGAATVAGRHIGRPVVSVSGVSVAPTIVLGSDYYFSALTGNFNITLPAGVAGEEVEIRNEDTAHFVGVKNSAGTLIQNLISGAASSLSSWGKFKVVGGDWIPWAVPGNPHA